MEPLGSGGGGIIFPEHPSPILHAPRDNISRKGNPSLRYIYIERERERERERDFLVLALDRITS